MYILKYSYKAAILLALLLCTTSALDLATQNTLASSTVIMAKTLHFMSYNVRYDSIPDDISVNQSLHALPKTIPSAPKYYANMTEQPWSLRRLYVANDVFFNDIDLLGTCLFTSTEYQERCAVVLTRSRWSRVT